MKILDAKVYEFPKGYLNPPTLQVLVDKLAKSEDFIYDRIEIGAPDGKNNQAAYFAEKDGEVRFYFHNPRYEHGYGGSVFTLNLKSGEQFQIKGPWSSRPGAMFPLFGVPCMDVSITSDPEAFKRGYTFFAGHITVDLARTALPFIPEWGISQEDSHEETVWQIRKLGNIREDPIQTDLPRDLDVSEGQNLIINFGIKK